MRRRPTATSPNPAALLAAASALLLVAALLTSPPRPAAADGDEEAATPPEPEAVEPGRDLDLLPEIKPGQVIPDGFDLPKDEADLAEVYGFPAPEEVGPRRPDSHDAAWLRRHATVARASTTACSTCHAESECRDCHQNVLKPLAIHPPGYLAYHPIEARREADRCQSCHTAQSFCRDCHVAARAGTSGPAQPPSGLRFHPPGWLGLTAGPEHGVEARRNLLACASCHTESDCVRCHVGVNPHPPDFIARCRSIARANATSCVRCHTNTQVLIDRCR